MASREAILRAADDMVRELRATGGSSTFMTVKQISRRAGVAVSTVYNQFPGGVGSIALQLVERRQAAGEPADHELTTLARMEQARAMAGSDAEAKIRAELAFLYLRRHADRARELMHAAESEGLSPDIRFLTRYAVAETIDDMLPESREELLALTKGAEDLAEAHGAPHVERLIMRDHRVNALMAPVNGIIIDGDDDVEAIRLLRNSSEYIRRHEILLTAYGWRYDAACRDLIAGGIEMRSVDDERELQLFFADQLGGLVQVLRQPREGHTGPDGMAVSKVMEAVLILEALNLIEQPRGSELFSQLDELHTQREADDVYSGYGYECVTVAAAVLRGHKSDLDDLTVDDLSSLTLRNTTTMLARLRVAAMPHDSRWPETAHRHPRAENRVRFEYFEPEFAIYENAEARRRIAAIIDMHPRAPEGCTEIRPEVLHELEATARRAIASGQPIAPESRQLLKRVWNLIVV
ncbi:hypothetical protein ASG84_22140 [Rhodococcus sp. Leaf278]|nr:hypothetical protein ASG84_22140 [Rhodococcus sp. Leaf278]